MWAFIITFLAVFIVVVILVALSAGGTKKRDTLAHERLDEDYTYRKEPHADQVAKQPNRLEGNEVTETEARKDR